MNSFSCVCTIIVSSNRTAVSLQEMARRPGEGVETRGGWKTTLQHIAVGRSTAPGGGGGGADDEGGGKSVPHVPVKVNTSVVCTKWYQFVFFS